MDFCMPRRIQLKKNGKALIERIDFPHTVTANLLDTGKALAPLKIADAQNGVNFYEEVTLFEIYLTKRAVEEIGGKQLQAAHLLNIKYTTLNIKIEWFQIPTAHPVAKIWRGN